jgi:hypothetical protein
MKFRRTTALPFALAFLVIMAHRLPAPIHEETPIPKPTIPERSKPKPENRIAATKKKESKPAITLFIGTWRGSVTCVYGTTVGLNGSGNATRTVRISSDGTVVCFGESGGQTGPPSQGRVVLSANGHQASWNTQDSSQGGLSQGMFSLQLIGPNSASYQENVSFNSPQGNGTLKASGNLTKQ